jgi:HAD superfamily hydrolase (TIGR01509 family)
MGARTVTQALFFDSDGVLVDTERLFYDATRAEFEAAGTPLTREQWARWYLGEGRPSREVASLLGLPADRVEETILRRDDRFWRRVDEGVPVLPGVVETLATLAGRYRLGVVTGASLRHFQRIHASSGLLPFFEAVVTRDDYHLPKPHPAAYLAALARFALDGGECLAVEDSPRGAASAAGAGVPCVVIPTPLTDRGLCPPGTRFVETAGRLPAVLGNGGAAA